VQGLADVLRRTVLPGALIEAEKEKQKRKRARRLFREGERERERRARRNGLERDSLGRPKSTLAHAQKRQ